MDNREAILQITSTSEARIFALDLRARYLTRKNLTGGNVQIELELGKLQSEIKEIKDWVEFLQSEVKTESKIEVEKE